jgi:hypothetical protein
MKKTILISSIVFSVFLSAYVCASSAYTGEILQSVSVSDPVDLAFDSDGYLYVLCSSPAQVRIYDRNLMLQTTLSVTATSPKGIAVSEITEPNDCKRLYIADTGADRLIRYRSFSGFDFAIDDTFGNSGIVGQSGSGEGEFNQPWDIAVSSNEKLYVADCNDNRIQAFDSGGNFTTQWGMGRFNRPAGICLPGDDELCVADANDQIQRCTSYGGTLVSQFGATGTNEGQFRNPTRLNYDVRFDRIVVADTDNNRIQFLQLSTLGLFQTEEITLAGVLTEPNLILPMAAIADPNLSDPDQIVYVADTGNNRILKLCVQSDQPGNSPLSVFNTFKAALLIDDPNIALDCFIDAAKEKYEPILELLRPYFVQMVSDMGEMIPVSRDTYTAVYDLLREEDNNQVCGYPVSFSKDDDGNWKISNF